MAMVWDRVHSQALVLSALKLRVVLPEIVNYWKNMEWRLVACCHWSTDTELPAYQRTLLLLLTSSGSKKTDRYLVLLFDLVIGGGVEVDETRSESCPLTSFCVSCTERLCFSSDCFFVIGMKSEVQYGLQYKSDLACRHMMCVSTIKLESVHLKI